MAYQGESCGSIDSWFLRWPCIPACSCASSAPVLFPVGPLSWFYSRQGSSSWLGSSIWLYCCRGVFASTPVRVCLIPCSPKKDAGCRDVLRSRQRKVLALHAMCSCDQLLGDCCAQPWGAYHACWNMLAFTRPSSKNQCSKE